MTGKTFKCWHCKFVHAFHGASWDVPVTRWGCICTQADLSVERENTKQAIGFGLNCYVVPVFVDACSLLSKYETNWTKGEFRPGGKFTLVCH